MRSLDARCDAHAVDAYDDDGGGVDGTDSSAPLKCRIIQQNSASQMNADDDICLFHIHLHLHLCTQRKRKFFDAELYTD